jgi:hypothetical protein
VRARAVLSALYQLWHCGILIINRAGMFVCLDSSTHRSKCGMFSYTIARASNRAPHLC